MKLTDCSALIMVAIVVSFIGFAVENIWLAFSKGFMDNRNMCLPTQYTSIPTSMGFAGIVFVVMRYGFDFFMHFFLELDKTMLLGMSIIFGLLLTIDMVYNLILMYKNGTGNMD